MAVFFGRTSNNNNNNNNNSRKIMIELTEEQSPYYKYTPANVMENDIFKLYWNRSILTDKTIILIDLI
jgi:ubiquitin C-terminal hydrolase